MCINHSIQEKYLEKNIHKLVWARNEELLFNELEFKINVAYFFAVLTKKNIRSA